MGTMNPKDPQAELRDILSELCWLAQAYEAKEFGGDELEAAIDDRTKKITVLFQAHQQELLKEANKVDRFEVIDDTGRAYVKGSIYGSPVSVRLDYQDDNRTLKVFVTSKIGELNG